MKNTKRFLYRFHWNRWLLLAGLVFCGLAPLVPMPVVNCPCVHGNPETLKSRVCSLCITAENKTAEIYFLKDINPRKPNRYLALPKSHSREMQSTSELPKGLRSKLWLAAANRGEELFPGTWGVAQNSHYFRTQCHAHLHIGPLSPEVQDVNGTLYSSVDDLPNVRPENGIWMHPKDGRYCVHLDRDLTEIVLVH